VELVPFNQDRVVWNGAELPADLVPPYQRVLDALRSTAEPVEIRVTTAVPVAAGLAGSAAVMAALATAAASYFSVTLSEESLSALARLGSGSAARSVPGGFAYWHRGSLADGSDSFATSIADPDHWPELRLVALFLDTSPKAISSTTGMRRSAETSPLYQQWIEACNRVAPQMERHIRDRNFRKLAAATREQAMFMHATCLTAQPPILYLSREAMALLEKLAEKLPTDSWCTTFDAGTNPIFLTLEEQLPDLLAALDEFATGIERLVAKPGVGARLEAPETGEVH
jgi:diphosphomevalonate decarboxylase